MLGAVMFGHQQFQPVIKAIKELAVAKHGKPRWEWKPAARHGVIAKYRIELRSSYKSQPIKIRDKQERQDKLKTIRKEIRSKVC